MSGKKINKKKLDDILSDSSDNQSEEEVKIKIKKNNKEKDEDDKFISKKG